MKKACGLLLILLSMILLCGCDQVMQQAENMTQQLNLEEVLTDVIENIDWNELKEYAQQGYEDLIRQFPALKGENIRQFLKDNGLELMKKHLESADESKQETANKLGQIIKILYPELTNEVDSVIDSN